MSHTEPEPQYAALLPGDVLDAMRCIVEMGVSIREFEYGLPCGVRATVLIPRTPAARAALTTLRSQGRAAAVQHLPAPDERRSLAP
jgi:hypothetical protein